MKINKDLIVEIPIRFKKGLEKKWEIKSRGRINLTGTQNCPLCVRFYLRGCRGCPFKKVTGMSGGCTTWIRKIRTDKKGGIYIFTPAQLKSFLIKAKAHIRWIK